MIEYTLHDMEEAASAISVAKDITSNLVALEREYSPPVNDQNPQTAAAQLIYEHAARNLQVTKDAISIMPLTLDVVRVLEKYRADVPLVATVADELYDVLPTLRPAEAPTRVD